MSLTQTGVEILRELVAIPTPSAVSNLPLLQWVAGFLDRCGWHSEFLPYEDPNGVSKANFIARPGSANRQSDIDQAFVCHTDTVPYAADWPNALVLEEHGGHLHGCGACDVKGSLACFLAAVSGLQSEEIAPSIALILTADEEIGCKGMERLLAGANLRIGSAIVSEPTSLYPGIAGKGYGLARVTITGREAHSAFPRQGVSAIAAAARFIAGMEEQFAESTSWTLSDQLFDPPHTTWNIGTIEGGSAKNIIPGRCSFLVEWRPIPGEAPSAFLDQLRIVIEAAQATQPQAKFDLEPLRAEPGFAPALQGQLQSRLTQLLAAEPTGISFGSEASRLAQITSEVVVIGPGDMRTAHSNRECVPIAELERWAHVLSQLIRS